MLTVSGLSKSFGATTVLRDVSFEIPTGACVAFIGENGAGKSTLAKCLVGSHQPDSGEIRMDGELVAIDSPIAARRLGIGFLPQELADVPSLSVAENIVLGAWPRRFGITRRGAIRAKAQQVLDRLGAALDLDAPSSSQTLAARQLAEIAKSLVRDSRLLVLDEPTAALSESDSEKLFQVVKKLASDGVTIVFISHRMDEVHKFADIVNVMRNGELVASLDPQASTKQDLVTHMLGSPTDLDLRDEAPPQAIGERPVALRVSGLVDAGPPVIDGISFDLRQGETLGIFGVRGSGNDAIAEILGGKRQAAAGTLTLDGVERSTFSGPSDAIRNGVAYVPQERKRDGLVLNQSIVANICMSVLKKLAGYGIRRPHAENALGQSFARQLDIRMRGLSQPVGQLSGGNQQKALLASRLATHPRVLVLHEPTRGVDVGARAQLLRELRRLALDGMACLVVSSDVEEVTTVCDRLIIIRDGVFVAELTGDEITQSNALHAATRGEASREAA